MAASPCEEEVVVGLVLRGVGEGRVKRGDRDCSACRPAARPRAVSAGGVRTSLAAAAVGHRCLTGPAGGEPVLIAGARSQLPHS